MYGLKNILLAVVIATLLGCGGGGGGSSGNALALNTSSVGYLAFAAGDTPEQRDIQVSWTDSRVAGYAIGTLPGQVLPAWLNVGAQGQSSPSTITLTRNSLPLAPGHYTTTIRVVSGDMNLKVLGQEDIAVTLDVVAVPTVTPASPTVVWVETEQPATQTLSISSDSRVQLVGATDNVSWIDATTAGDTVSLLATANAATLAPGSLAGEVQTTFSLDGRQRVVTTPIAGLVQQGLVGPSALAFEVNASSTLSSLSRTVTVTAATQGNIPFTVSSSASWLTVSGSTTGAANNLAVSLPANEVALLTFGARTAMITITPTAGNVSPRQIPVTMNLRLPEVHFVAPVAYTNAVATEPVIIRGAGFQDAAAQLLIAGTPMAGATVISDTEIRVVPGARTAGSYPVEVSNQLGLARDVANLRVAQTPVYTSFTLAATVGLQERVVASPINQIVVADMCWFCIASLGTQGSIQRFAWNPGNGEWTRTEHIYPGLYDFAFSPDESQLIVLTDSSLLLVDPQSMATIDSYTLPGTPGGTVRQLAVLNNGLVIIDGLFQAFSLRTQQFLPIAGLSGRGGISTSGDGSRALFGSRTGPGPEDVTLAYFDASTNSIVLSGTLESADYRASYGRRADVAHFGNDLLNQDLSVRGTFPNATFGLSAIAPDGSRGYGLDSSAGVLRIIDSSGPQPWPELLPVAAPGINGQAGGRLGIDPSGAGVFIVGETMFTVVPVP